MMDSQLTKMLDSFWKGHCIPALSEGRNRSSGHTVIGLGNERLTRLGSGSIHLGLLKRVRTSSSCLPAKIRCCWSGDALLALDLGLDIVDGVGGLDLHSIAGGDRA